VPTPPKKTALKSTIKKITNWSFSRWQEYVTCPFKAYCKVILKLKEPGGPALDRGNETHLLAQAYVGAAVPEMGYNEAPRSKGLQAKLVKVAKGWLPPELETFTEEFKAIRKRKYGTELQWCFRSDWSLTKWDDWNGVWLRVKCDAHNSEVADRHGVFVDYKTGKKYPEKHDSSLELYALAMFLVYPHLKTVTAALWYLDLGEETTRDFTVDMVPALKKQWTNQTFKMLNDTRFVPKPSGFACRYCHFRKENGGPCKH
jgi:hypothetical protein